MSDKKFAPVLKTLAACGSLEEATTSISEQMEAQGLDGVKVSIVAVVLPEGFTTNTFTDNDGKQRSYTDLGIVWDRLVFPTPFGSPAVADVKVKKREDGPDQVRTVLRKARVS